MVAVAEGGAEVIFAIVLIVIGGFIATQNTKSRIAVPLLVVGMVLLVKPMFAHDHARPDLDAWFNRLTSGKGLCCSNNDGTALSDVDWESKDGHYRVRLDNEWIDVPEDAVITEPNRAGRTMVWPIKYNGGTSVRCFLPGSMT